MLLLIDHTGTMAYPYPIDWTALNAWRATYNNIESLPGGTIIMITPAPLVRQPWHRNAIFRNELLFLARWQICFRPPYPQIIATNEMNIVPQNRPGRCNHSNPRKRRNAQPVYARAQTPEAALPKTFHDWTPGPGQDCRQSTIQNCVQITTTACRVRQAKLPSTGKGDYLRVNRHTRVCTPHYWELSVVGDVVGKRSNCFSAHWLHPSDRCRPQEAGPLYADEMRYGSWFCLVSSW